jgi:simple sugar transport system substrate-binding protein
LVVTVLTGCGGAPATPATGVTATGATAEAATAGTEATIGTAATETTGAATETTGAATETTGAATETATTADATTATVGATTADTTTATAAATETATTAATTTGAAAPAGSGQPLTVGMVLVGPTNDRGYNQAHFEAMKRAEQAVPGMKFIYVDKVNPSDRPNVKVEQVVDQLVDQGAKLVITNSDDFKDGTRVAAESHPDVTFVHMSGDDVLAGKNPPNLGNIWGKMEYGKMMAGCAAALQTKTGKISYLGPLINDETRRLTNATYLGARYCWTNVLKKPAQDLKFKVTWIGFWFNLPGVTLDPSKVATDFLNEGYDVNISGIDTTEGLVETNKAAGAGKQVYAVAYDFKDGCAEAPNVCLGVPYFNWAPAYIQLVKQVQSGTWKPEWKWLDPDWKDINNAETSTVGFVEGPGLAPENKQKLDAFIKGLGDGSINLWQGPLNFQDGTSFLIQGEKANDKQIWYTPQLLQGIEGQSAAPQ